MSIRSVLKGFLAALALAAPLVALGSPCFHQNQPVVCPNFPSGHPMAGQPIPDGSVTLFTSGNSTRWRLPDGSLIFITGTTHMPFVPATVPPPPVVAATSAVAIPNTARDVLALSATPTTDPKPADFFNALWGTLDDQHRFLWQGWFRGVEERREAAKALGLSYGAPQPASATATVAPAAIAVQPAQSGEVVVIFHEDGTSTVRAPMEGEGLTRRSSPEVPQAFDPLKQAVKDANQRDAVGPGYRPPPMVDIEWPADVPGFGAGTLVQITGLPTDVQGVESMSLANGEVAAVVAKSAPEAGAPRYVFVKDPVSGGFDLTRIGGGAPEAVDGRVTLQAPELRLTVPPAILTAPAGAPDKTAAPASAADAQRDAARRIARDLADADPAKQERGEKAVELAAPEVKAQVGELLRAAHLSAAQIAGDSANSVPITGPKPYDFDHLQSLNLRF
jgi:hypothetical protein